MANYANLLAQIAANIYSNNNQDITGDGLKAQLNAMVASLGAGYQFMGVAHPADTPSGYADLRAFWLAGEAGTYANFGGAVVFPGEVALLKWDSAWSKSTASISETLALELGLDGFSAPLGGYYITTVYTHGVNANMYCTKLLKVTPGDKYIFSGYYSSAVFPAVAGYADMQGTSPQTLVQSGNNVDVEITIPSGVNYIEAWGQKDHTLSLIKAEVYGSKSEVDLLFHEYLVGSGLNYFDGGETGKYIAPGGGLGSNASYKISQFAETAPGRQYLYNGKNTSSGLSIVWGYAAKDRSGAVALVPAGNIDGSLLFIVPSGVNYIQAQTTTDRAGILVEQEKKILTYGTTSGPFRDFLENNVINPSKNNQYVILVQPGTYDLSSEITAAEISGGTFRGITLPDFTTLVGVAGPDATKFTLDISSNAISTLNLVGTASLIGLTIEGKHCRYAVHDDFSSGDSGVERNVKHCKFIASDCTYGYAYGGGLRSGQKWSFEDCYFDGYGGFLMHSNVGFTQPTELVLRDCVCVGRAGHPEKAIEIRGLAGVANAVLNYAKIENCKFDGMLLTGSNGYFDWRIIIAGCIFGSDITKSGTTYSPTLDTGGNMKFINGAPRWWNGSAFVDADGN